MTPQELKNSILQMAIQGKLVEQRPEEGTAEELYQQIQAEKQELIKEKKIKKEKTIPEITDDEKPFDVPDSWKWVRFGKIMINRDSERVPLSVAERSKLEKIYDYYGASGVIDKVDNYLFDKKLLLIGEDGANLLTRSTPIAYLAMGKYWVNNHAHVLDCNEDHLCMEYIMYFINAISLAKYVTGTAQPKMNQEKMNSILVSLPPLAEQKRIVAKIEELLPLIDRYEVAWSRLEAFNKRFPEDMQKSILQEAIQGKLVEQRPEEGTAEELYQQIQAEKQKLIKEKKIKKDKPLPEITDDEKPFEIPDSWKWVRFGKIMINRDSERVPLSVAERSKLEKVYDYYGASGVIDKVDNYLFDKKLLLIGEDGANLLTRSTPIAYLATGKYWVNNHAHVLDCNEDHLCMEYIMYFINAIGLAKYVTGTAQPKMNQEKMNSIPVPLPPLAEQKRIVAKIEQLLPLCDLLKK